MELCGEQNTHLQKHYSKTAIWANKKTDVQTPACTETYCRLFTFSTPTHTQTYCTTTLHSTHSHTHTSIPHIAYAHSSGSFTVFISLFFDWLLNIHGSRWLVSYICFFLPSLTITLSSSLSLQGLSRRQLWSDWFPAKSMWCVCASSRWSLDRKRERDGADPKNMCKKHWEIKRFMIINNLENVKLVMINARGK